MERNHAQVQRVERHILKPSPELRVLCHNAKNLYNYTNYLMRQAYFRGERIPSAYELIKQFTKDDQPDYRSLPAKTSQQIIKLVGSTWNSFLQIVKDYHNHPKKYLAQPRPPRYKKKDGLYVVIFTNQQAKLKDRKVVFPQATQLPPLPTHVSQLNQVRIVPLPTVFAVEVVHTKEVTLADVHPDNILAIDLGLGNLATCVSTVGVQPFIINGRPLRKINAYFNKEYARLKSFAGNRTSKRIARLAHKRNMKVADYLHKVSAYIRTFCIEHQIGTVAVGKNKGWKYQINLGKQVNQKFTFLPFNKLLHQLTYKLGEVGIIVIFQEESHTSRCDHLAGERIGHHAVYSGKRLKRGLFQSAAGQLINADVNGAIGIGIKAVGNVFLERLLDTGVVLTPVRINIF